MSLSKLRALGVIAGGSTIIATGAFLLPGASSVTTVQQVNLSSGAVARVNCSGDHLKNTTISPVRERVRCVAATNPVPPPTTTTPAPTTGNKVLTIVEENHSYAQMKAGMPYLFGLSQQYGYATNWSAITHPSEPNYLAIAGGSTFGISNDSPPATNAPKVGQAKSVFDQALDKGLTAKTYSENIPSNCYLTAKFGTFPQQYAVKHNPWAFFSASRARCNSFDVDMSTYNSDIANNTLPNAGMVVPNLCNDAHSCKLSVADAWLKSASGGNLPAILASSDFTSGNLTVVITADESSGSPNTVLTTVLNANLHGKVVTTPLTHYSLTKFYAQELGATPLLNGAGAADMKAAFGL